jgi:hypothetical protein
MDVELCDLTVDVSLRFTRRWKIIAPSKKNAGESRDVTKSRLPCVIPRTFVKYSNRLSTLITLHPPFHLERIDRYSSIWNGLKMKADPWVAVVALFLQARKPPIVPG